jgi:hypothetical protein
LTKSSEDDHHFFSTSSYGQLPLWLKKILKKKKTKNKNIAAKGSFP